MNDLRPEHRRRFRRLVNVLNRLRDEVVAGDFPDACYYLANDELNLLSGPSHDDRGLTPFRDRVLDSTILHRSSGGDW